MFRIATLVDAGGPFLEVRVQKDGFEKKEEAKSITRNITGQTSLGSICFYDEREPQEISRDFARTYQTPNWAWDNEESFLVEYSKGLTIIPQAFVIYFSNRNPPQE